MDFELRRAREKLEREQKESKDKARMKLDRERKSKSEALKHLEAIEAVQRFRRINALEAQLKADQQTQESLLIGSGVVFQHVLQAVPLQGNGDKIKLPPSCFTALSDQGAFDKGPMYFRLSTVHQESPQTRRTTHSGVLEFTADEGLVALPPHVWNNLFPTGPILGSTVEVCYVRLPKGTYSKLQPEGMGFSDIPNHKAVLETSLRQHATLSQDDILTVNHGNLAYKLRVLELKPASSVSVLETDIEVDIVGPDAASMNTDNQYILEPLFYGKPESGMAEENNYNYYKFSIDNETWKRIDSCGALIEIKLESESNEGDTDVYLSQHPLIFPNRHQHEWSSHDMGSKALTLSSKDKSLGVGTYSIGVYGFKGTSKYKLLVSLKDKVADPILGQRDATSSSSSGSSMEMDTVECRNCKHYIPNRTIGLHEAYCSRHNVTCKHDGCGIVLRVEEAKNHVHCEKCGKAFQHGEMEKHMTVFHEPLHCPCGALLEKELMVQHQASICPLRLVTCRYCGDMVKAGDTAMDVRDRMRGLNEHESVCGSRTAPCASCGRSVMLKDMDIHQVAVHQKN